MTILWLVNIILPEAGAALQINSSVFGGWLTGALNGVRNQAHITVAAVGGNDVRNTMECDTNHIHYVVFPPQSKEELKETFQKYLARHDFDVIHIYGTEMVHTAVMTELAPPKKTVINIQGLTSTYVEHYCEGIPMHVVRDTAFRNILRHFLRGRFLEQPVSSQMQWIVESGKREIETIRDCKNIIGRTGWDRACVTRINPGVHYYHVNETLRDSFYTNEKWSPDKCQRRSIFLSQAGYPIKGLHYFMQALTIIKEYYPDVHVYMGGGCNIAKNVGVRAWRDRNFGGYWGYVNTYLADHDLFSCFTLCGLMDEHEMAQQYLNANVFVCPSTIENSPNSVGEAMILGTPVVASYVGGVPDMMDNGKEGLLYQSSAPYMLADCVMRIFSNDELAMTLSQNAIDRAHITHDRKKNAKDLLAVYEEIIRREQE